MVVLFPRDEEGTDRCRLAAILVRGAARPLLTPSRDKSVRRCRLHEVRALAASLASVICFCTPSRRYSSGSSRSNADTARRHRWAHLRSQRRAANGGRCRAWLINGPSLDPRIRAASA